MPLSGCRSDLPACVPAHYVHVLVQLQCGIMFSMMCQQAATTSYQQGAWILLLLVQAVL